MVDLWIRCFVIPKSLVKIVTTYDHDIQLIHACVQLTNHNLFIWDCLRLWHNSVSVSMSFAEQTLNFRTFYRKRLLLIVYSLWLELR